MLPLPTIAILLSRYGYFLLLPIAIVEGPIITVIAAFLASTGVFNVYIVYAIAVTGDLIGDGLWYWIARSGSQKFLRGILKHGSKFGITEQGIEYAETRLKDNFLKTVLVGKITGILMLPIIIASGSLKVSYKKFVMTAQSIDVVKDLIFTSLGFFAGKYYLSINHDINTFFTASTVLVLICITVYLFVRYVRNKYNHIV